MKAFLVGTCVALILSDCTERGPTWSGTIAGTGPEAVCSGQIRMTVRDGRADGTYKIGYNARRAVTGTVDAHGAFRGNDGAISGAFSGTHFSGSFPNIESAPYCGALWRIAMSRETYQ